MIVRLTFTCCSTRFSFITLPPARGRWSRLAGSVAEDGIMMHVQSLVDDGLVLDAEVDFVFDPSITRNLLSCPIFDRFVWRTHVQ